MLDLILFGLAPLLAAAPAEPGLCGSGRPHLVLATTEGTISAELFETAAPRTLQGLAELLKAPRHEPLAFDYTHPHVEIYSGWLRERTFFENELDADALGLHQARIEGAGQAMDVLQRELIPAFNKVKKAGRLDPRLREWMQKWRESGSAAFLIGASRKDVNEALGYAYTAGLGSRPVAKGALTLQPESPARARARLGIALSDLPLRLGRQMVIGRVIEGLDLADRVSTRPLAVAKGMRSLDWAPRQPVAIESVRFECRE